ncbi:MAG: hypothetical protein EPN49_10895 [Rhodanobacter sp.]|nr:MAG: hypothetical protein EPN49_10895 [Rhodanobacter sp.]
MQVCVESGQLIYSRGSIPALFPVLDAREIGDAVVVLYDYMAFPRNEPSRNLFAYSSQTGKELWRAEDIGAGAIDGYTSFITEVPLVVANFACFNCQIDIQTGKVVGKAFTK